MKKEDFTEKAPGRLIPAPGHPGIVAFVPAALSRQIEIPAVIARKTERAAVLLGRLAGAGRVLNPWVHLFLRREAIASSAIEGTITTARELYAFEAGEIADGAQEREVLNYMLAATKGLELIETRGLSLNVMADIHGVLMMDVRGSSKRPGEFRKEQNAISPTKRIEDARFVPPPVPQMTEALHDLESFIHEPLEMPDLIKLALIHYQFETIHPFLDGNGRIGRLLLPVLLCTWGALPPGPPKLYLSSYLEQHDDEYRHRLLRVSQNGEWNEWIGFFLDAVIAEAGDTWQKLNELETLQASYHRKVSGASGKLRDAVDHLFFVSPVVRVRDISTATGLTRQRSSDYIETLVKLGILSPGRKQWGRLYFANEIMSVFFGNASGSPERDEVDSGGTSKTTAVSGPEQTPTES